MSWPRPRRVLAVARRDLACQLSGRRGWVLPVVLAGLLLPAALVPTPQLLPEPSPVITVKGDVPAEVLALPDVREVQGRASLTFRQEDGRLVVEGRSVPPPVREVLDEGPQVRVERLDLPLSLPGRSLLLALVAASVLTGAVAESLPGERSARTLDVLLSAGLTRMELVLGKWVAWGGLGAGAALLSALVAILAGHVSPGWWVVALPTVPICTVALGLFLVRRSSDVVGGTAVSMRVLPALLMVGGLFAWLLGRLDPLLGAALPLGGALVAAGAAWSGPGPPLLAAASTGAVALGLIGATRRGLLTTHQPLPVAARHLAAAVRAVAVVGPVWWIAVLGPLLWAAGGNPAVSEFLSPARSALAAGLVLVLVSAIHLGRVPRPADEIGLRGAPWRATLAAAICGACLGLAFPAIEPTLQAGARLQAALHPLHAGLGVLLISVLAQEVLWRGWVQARAGPLLAALAFAAVHAPFDPAHGLLMGGVLAGLVHAGGGSLLPALVARAAWIGALLALPAAPDMVRLGAAALALVVALAVLRGAPPHGEAARAPAG